MGPDGLAIAVAFYDKPFIKFERILETYLAYAPWGIRSFVKAIPLWVRQKLWMKEIIKDELDNKGKVKKSPEMDRRIDIYKKFHEGFGEMLVQMNVEDTRLGTAEYVSSKHNLDTIELKWG